MVALKTRRRWWLVAVVALIVTACTSGSGQPDQTTSTAAQPTTSVTSVAEPPTNAQGSLAVVETRPLPVAPVSVAVADGVVWVVGFSDRDGAALYAVGADSLEMFEVGILPTDVAVGSDGAWVANDSGAGTLYNSSTGQGPGFPLENSVQRVGSAPLVVPIDDPLDVAVVSDWLWALRPGGGDGGATITLVDESSGDILGTTELDGLGGELVVVDGAVWVAATDGREVESWLLYELASDPLKVRRTLRGLGAPRYVVPGPDAPLFVTQGPDATLLVVDVSGDSPGSVFDLGISWVTAAAGDGRFLWIATEDGSVRVFDPNTGTQVASAVLDSVVKQLTVANDGTVWGVSEHQAFHFDLSR